MFLFFSYCNDVPRITWVSGDVFVVYHGGLARFKDTEVENERSVTLVHVG